MAPGEIMFGNRGAVVVGELDGAPHASASRRIHGLLTDFEPDAVISDNIWGYLYGKGGYGAVLKASALTNDTMADFIAAIENRPLIVALVREVLAVARAEGVTPLGFNGFDPEAFLDGDDDAHRRLHCRHGGVQSAHGEGAQRHLARPGGAASARATPAPSWRRWWRSASGTGSPCRSPSG